MGQDPNQPYPGQYGQPQQEPYQAGYQQGGYPPPPNSGYPPPPNTDYQQQGYQNYQQQGDYQQQYQYQQPYGQPGQLYYTSHPMGATSINMDPNTAAGLSYFTWIAGLIFFLVEKQNRFVRFNAMQEILLTGVVVVLNIILAVTFFLSILIPLVWIAGFVLWLICVINAFQGKYFKLPVIGDYAERIAGSGGPRVM